MATRVCSKCGEAKPATQEFFYRESKYNPAVRLAAQCKICRDKTIHAWNVKNRDRKRRVSKEWFARLKAGVIQAYGGRCACCGETIPEFLTLEHLRRDGKAHRRSVAYVYLDLKRRGYPQDDYTLLCWNCNEAVRWGDQCPHQIGGDRVESERDPRRTSRALAS